ncbi:hypothetical protein MGG_17535 [Pyricularia oryzae 70-15]|uniref:Uncharacterized protein n=1 Tax=Pyricularia oryzae (strain 70-15 / ATCC MYA-4617 / FGSC 8958) TaxID=242507 RepID=G4NEH0_PYRO7|nr:uncharacterized protein MGG_17535 [Pyricularia oryzae 70-15]EHA49447.1 hypothetical protein MGG_17535 [Pyricularia oryzae 70-15]
MDVYGAFQLSAIAVLAAPVTVRVSDTYFFGPGRNIIFVWTGIILAGMLSLTVEFYRSNAIHCDESNWGNFTTYNPEDFPYSVGNLCGITCSEEHGPFSPMRKDATAEIYIIPAPVKFNFGTATLTAAACCIPAILSLASLMNKIREFNWRRSRMGGWRDAKQDPGFDEPIDGFHGATFRTMNSVNNNVRHLLRFIEIPLFAAAVAAILIIGELNLWDPHIVHGTEPIASVGQWAPIVTAGLAALGSLYLLIEKDATAAEMEEEARQTGNSPGTGCCSCTQHHGQWSSPIDSHNHHPWSAGPTEPLRTFDTAGEGSNNSCSPILTRQNSRMKIAKYINKIGKAISTPASDLDDASFRAGPAGDFPEAPGERLRDPRIQEIQKVYNIWRDANGNSYEICQSWPSSKDSTEEQHLAGSEVKRIRHAAAFLDHISAGSCNGQREGSGSAAGDTGGPCAELYQLRRASGVFPGNRHICLLGWRISYYHTQDVVQGTFADPHCVNTLPYMTYLIRCPPPPQRMARLITCQSQFSFSSGRTFCPYDGEFGRIQRRPLPP